MDKRNRTKGQTMIYSTLHRQLKIEKHEPHKNTGINSGGKVSTPLVASSCYSCYKHCNKSWMRKWRDCDYNKRNTSVVIYDTEIFRNG
jgi:hypothetical protein